MWISDSFYKLFQRPKRNISSLDGIRSLAIIMVLCFHARGFVAGEFGRESILFQLPPFNGGWVGVPLFFTLSGFLIGQQIWLELKTSGSVNFWQFFLRRGFRIWPLFYFLFILFTIFPYKEGVQGYWVNALFLSNILGDEGPITGSWSLATEEQFYIIFPLFLIIASKLISRSSRKLELKKIRIWLYVLFFTPTIVRFFIWDFVLKLSGQFDLNIYMQEIYRPIYTNSEALIGGLILSSLALDNKLPTLGKMKSWGLLAFSMLAAVLSFKSKVYFNFLGIAFASTVLVWFCLKNSNYLTSFLSMPIFGTIAKCSFSMYLINWPILCGMKTLGWLNFGSNLNLSLLISTVILIIISVIVSFANFILIEDPFLNLRKQYLQSKNEKESIKVGIHEVN